MKTLRRLDCNQNFEFIFLKLTNIQVIHFIFSNFFAFPKSFSFPNHSPLLSFLLESLYQWKESDKFWFTTMAGPTTELAVFLWRSRGSVWFRTLFKNPYATSSAQGVKLFLQHLGRRLYGLSFRNFIFYGSSELYFVVY